MKMQLYDYYPDHPDLVEKAEALIAKLGGGTYRYRGGVGFQLLSRTVGWKTAKRLRLAWRRLADGKS
jgi:hypothetical protein